MSDSPKPPVEPEQQAQDPILRQVGEANLRLMAGEVSKPKLAQLKISAQANESEYPWQQITEAILSEDVDRQRLVQRGLAAQRDWVLRGGRVERGPTMTRRAKGFVARLAAQLIFALIFLVVVVVGLLLLEYRFPAWDIDRLLDMALDLFGAERRKA